MLILALSEAATTTIVYVIVWFVAFPALVTGLIAVAILQTYRERQENIANRRREPR
jgi:F0F1-type ATP synthase membrane subunit b/b'